MKSSEYIEMILTCETAKPELFVRVAHRILEKYYKQEQIKSKLLELYRKFNTDVIQNDMALFGVYLNDIKELEKELDETI